jgi:hypothetical protein
MVLILSDGRILDVKDDGTSTVELTPDEHDVIVWFKILSADCLDYCVVGTAKKTYYVSIMFEVLITKWIEVNLAVKTIDAYIGSSNRLVLITNDHMSYRVDSHLSSPYVEAVYNDKFIIVLPQMLSLSKTIVVHGNCDTVDVSGDGVIIVDDNTFKFYPTMQSSCQSYSGVTLVIKCENTLLVHRLTCLTRDNGCIATSLLPVTAIISILDVAQFSYSDSLGVTIIQDHKMLNFFISNRANQRPVVSSFVDKAVEFTLTKDKVYYSKSSSDLRYIKIADLLAPSYLSYILGFKSNLIYSSKPNNVILHAR